MLNKIKDKILHVLRNYCEYYKLEKEYNKYRTWYHECDHDFVLLMESSEKLSARHEAKILEYDILKHQFNNLVDIITDKATMPEINDLEYIIECFNREKQKDYKKYLVAELEEILNIMKEKGIHPQDLIKRIINKVKRDIKE